MPEQVETLVRAWFERLADGDPAPDLCDPEIEIRNWAESPVPGPYRGHGGLHAWWRGVNDTDVGVEFQLFKLEKIVPIDDARVLTIQNASGRGRSSGLEFDRRWGSVISVRAGKIASAVGYPSAEEAFEAAGLQD